jgi:exopolyphosphatase/guanosine-5'-triphosphate,3'-diphosphate pyrophosphatase
VWNTRSSKRVQTRLGAHPEHLLPPPAIDATLHVARHFLTRVRREHGPVRAIAIATAAVRDAPNRDALIEPLIALGVSEVRILSGEEEGRLGAEAALRARPIEQGMVIDLGGGSLQMTSVEQGTIQSSQSAPLGVARLHGRFIESDPAQPTELERLRSEIRSQLVPLLRVPPARGHALASGGVVGALARQLSARCQLTPGAPAKPSMRGFEIRLSELQKLRASLARMTLDARARVLGASPERADVIVVGAMVLEEFLAMSDYPGLIVSRSSVREGVLWREAQKLAAD